MNSIIKTQLDTIRAAMLNEATGDEQVMAVDSMNDEELLVLVFDNLLVAKGQEGYLLTCLMDSLN